MSNDDDIEEMKIERPKKCKKSKKVTAVLEDEIIEEMKLLSVNPIDETILNVYEKINKNKDKRIILLRDVEVVKWIFNDISFLKGKNQNELKILEDEWGLSKLKKKRPDLNSKHHWTTKFGECIAEELCILQNKTYKCQKKNTTSSCEVRLDIETEDSIIEVKTGTRYTEGTAHNKISDVPHAYADIPIICGKPLKILCIGKAEEFVMERGYIQSKNTVRTKINSLTLECLEIYKKYNITFISIREELLNLN